MLGIIVVVVLLVGVALTISYYTSDEFKTFIDEFKTLIDILINGKNASVTGYIKKDSECVPYSYDNPPYDTKSECENDKSQWIIDGDNECFEAKDSDTQTRYSNKSECFDNREKWMVVDFECKKVITSTGGHYYKESECKKALPKKWKFEQGKCVQDSSATDPMTEEECKVKKQINDALKEAGVGNTPVVENRCADKSTLVLKDGEMFELHRSNSVLGAIAPEPGTEPGRQVNMLKNLLWGGTPEATVITLHKSDTECEHLEAEQAFRMEINGQWVRLLDNARGGACNSEQSKPVLTLSNKIGTEFYFESDDSENDITDKNEYAVYTEYAGNKHYITMCGRIQGAQGAQNTEGLSVSDSSEASGSQKNYFTVVKYTKHPKEKLRYGDWVRIKVESEGYLGSCGVKSTCGDLTISTGVSLVDNKLEHYKSNPQGIRETTFRIIPGDFDTSKINTVVKTDDRVLLGLYYTHDRDFQIMYTCGYEKSSCNGNGYNHWIVNVSTKHTESEEAKYSFVQENGEPTEIKYSNTLFAIAMGHNNYKQKLYACGNGCGLKRVLAIEYDYKVDATNHTWTVVPGRLVL